jgi:hypothetical protein
MDVINYIRDLIEKKFTGKITVLVSGGNVYEVFESVKKSLKK